jgi:hypothetical protein
MMFGNYQQVVRIHPVNGATIEKLDGGYQISVIYELSDGTNGLHHIWSDRKRDVKAELEMLPCAPQRLLYADVQGGKVYGTTS